MVGSTRYQIVAVLLTYLAISASAVPLMVHQVNKDIEAKNKQALQDAAASAQTAGVDPATVSAKLVRMDWSKVTGQLVLWTVASPFLELQEPGSGMLGLVILFVGLSIAFRLTKARPLAVDGPYSVAAS